MPYLYPLFDLLEKNTLLYCKIIIEMLEKTFKKTFMMTSIFNLPGQQIVVSPIN